MCACSWCQYLHTGAETCQLYSCLTPPPGQCTLVETLKLLCCWSVTLVWSPSAGELIPRHQQVFSNNQFFCGVSIPEPQEKVRLTSGHTWSPSDFTHFSFFSPSETVKLTSSCHVFKNLLMLAFVGTSGAKTSKRVTSSCESDEGKTTRFSGCRLG